MDGNDLRELATLLQGKKPGFYVVLQQAGHVIRLSALHRRRSRRRFSMKDLGAWLKAQGVQGGGSGLMVQGSGTLLAKS